MLSGTSKYFEAKFWFSKKYIKTLSSYLCIGITYLKIAVTALKGAVVMNAVLVPQVLLAVTALIALIILSEHWDFLTFFAQMLDVTFEFCLVLNCSLK